MSRIAKSPITIPDGVEVSQSGEVLTVKGKLGEITMNVHSSVTIKNTENVLTFLLPISEMLRADGFLH